MRVTEDPTFLDEIYATALDVGLWPSVMSRFADIVGGNSGFLSAFDSVTGRGEAILSRFDIDTVGAYNQYYAAINPIHHSQARAAYGRDWRLTILTDEDKVPKAELVKSEYYNDFMLPNDSHAVMMIRLGRDHASPQVLNISRSPKQGVFEARDLERAAYYHPHFVRAFRLGRKLAANQSLDDELSMMRGASPNGLFVVASDARIVSANAAGEAMLRDSSGLKAMHGRLTIGAADAGRRFAALVGAAASEDGLRVGGAMAVFKSDSRVALTVSVTPMRRRPDHAIFQDARLALVCVTDPTSGEAVAEARLRELFGLTPAETRIVVALLDAGDLRGAASKVGISFNTARVHLARIYEKTGTNRQIALTSLVLRSAGADFGIWASAQSSTFLS